MRSAGINRNPIAFLTALVAAALLLGATASGASAAPAWEIVSLSSTAAAPGDADDLTPEHTFLIQARNIGDASAESSAEPIEIDAELPAGLSLVDVQNIFGPEAGSAPVDCPIVQGTQSVTCTFDGALDPISFFNFRLRVSVAPGASGIKTATFTVSGGTGGSNTTADPVRILAMPPPFGLDAFDVSATADATEALFSKAGGHPYEIAAEFDLNTLTNPELIKGIAFPVEPVRDVVASAPAGVLGNPIAFEQCTAAELAMTEGVLGTPECPLGSQVGVVTIRFNASEFIHLTKLPLFNMVPPSGSPARFGFNVSGVTVLTDARLRSESDYGVDFVSRRLSEGLGVSGSNFTFWGVPTDERHDALQTCVGQGPIYQGSSNCPPTTERPAFLRMPTRCTPPGEGLPWKISVDSWEDPGAELATDIPDLSDPAWSTRAIDSHEAPGYPFSPEDPSTPWGPERGVEDCDQVPVQGTLEAGPTTPQAETSSGLNVHVEIPNPGLESPTGIASSDIKRVNVKLPQGVTINPSQAEGLGACSKARYESTELSFFPTPGKGCPDDSKIGTVSVKTPILEETLPGNVYVAEPYANPFNSLLAIYIVIAEPERGILIKLPGEVRTNEKTGQVEAEFDDLPQAPFDSFDFKFREGARAPLITPPTCGTYTTETEITGWSSVDPVTGKVDPKDVLRSKSRFVIDRGIGGGPCPQAGTPGFKPTFSAGSINNNAGAYSPFTMRLTRKDGEQDMTRFSAVLPPGVLGKLAGVSKCPDSAIAQAKARTGPHGGMEEIQSPSCPANSLIGRSLVGAGVGSVLTYVPGKVYLGGPFNGRPLSVIAITPVVAGPFDVGTVVVQEALTLNPKTAEVEVDGSASDPIPHILKGIPAKLRDLRVYVDRPEFTLNPTSCDPSATEAELFGGGANAFTSTDDVPVLLQDRFQASNCAALGFKPKLGLKLKGGTRRGNFPGLQATYRPRPGDANVEGLVVRLPRSAFLEQGHIRTICTRVQFAADACPKGSQYGYIKAWTPLLDEPLQGPVWLRSSNHKLPDLVFDLHGLVDVEVATRIDSVRGGVRASVDSVPDAPLSKVVLRMQGGKKGLIVNSRNLCTSTNKANVESDGQNGKVSDFNPVMRPDCRGKRKPKRR